MENLIVKGTQKFCEKEMPIIEGGFGEGKRILFDRTISEVHNMENKEIRKSIMRLIQKDRLKEDMDYIDLKSERGKEFTTLDLLIEVGYSKSAITQAQNIFVLSERGYTKLIKSMDDDKSWDIMDKLIDDYFKMKEVINELESKKSKALLDIYNGGIKGIEGAKILADIEVAEAVKPLEEKIVIDAPYVSLAKKRLDSNGLISITDTNQTFECKKGRITRWLKNNGYLHKTNTEVNKLGEEYFRCYMSKGFRCIGVNSKGLEFINEHIEEIKAS